MQSVVEQQLASTIQTARQTYDEVTHKNYVADSGAAIVMEAKTGRIVAMASQPTYDPSVWVGGISKKELARLYSEEAGEPLLGRATQGQFAPGSTWKPIMTVGALNNGFSEDTRLDCSSGLQVGNRWFKNYESASDGLIGFDKALQLSCDTFFYRVGLQVLAAVRHRRDRRRTPRTRWSQRPRTSASARAPASTCRARRPAGSRTGSGSSTTGSR